MEGGNSVTEVEIWKTVVSTISRSGKVVKTVRYKVEQCSSDPRYPEQENLIPDSKTFDRKICDCYKRETAFVSSIRQLDD